MLRGPLKGKVFRFALPLALTGVLQQLFNAADVAVVGRFAGKYAMAAVGANTAVVGLMITMFIGISIGANVVIAIAIGNGSARRIRNAVHTALLFALLGGVGIFIIGEAVASPLMRLLGVPDEVLPMAVKYLRVYLAGMPVILFYNFEAAILRAKGDTKSPLMALTAAGVINVLLNLFFVIKCHMAAAGVSLATVLANVVSAGILLRVLSKSEDALQVRIRELRIHGETLRSILRIGLPAGMQSSVKSIANVLIQSAINSLGATVMAGSSAAFNVEVMVFFVLDAFGQTCTTFVGQNYGAGQYERCKKALFTCLTEDVIATGLTIGLLVCFGRNLLTLFNDDPKVIHAGMTRMRYLMCAFPFSMCNEILAGFLRGFGISMPPAMVSLIGVCGVRILWIIAVFPRLHTFSGLMMVYPVSLGVAALASLVMVLVLSPSKRALKA